MELTRQDIDQLVRNFRARPSEDGYTSIKNWYESNVSFNNDQEYMICIYLFLLGANITNRFEDYTYDQHNEFIKDIRNTIETADPLVRSQRKTYLDYGTKGGIYK